MDQIYGVALKEMAEVIKFMAVHPMTTLLGGTGDSLTNDVKLTNEYSLAANRWLAGEGDPLVVGGY